MAKIDKNVQPAHIAKQSAPSDLAPTTPSQPSVAFLQRRYVDVDGIRMPLGRAVMLHNLMGTNPFDPRIDAFMAELRREHNHNENPLDAHLDLTRQSYSFGRPVGTPYPLPKDAWQRVPMPGYPQGVFCSEPVRPFYRVFAEPVPRLHDGSAIYVARKPRSKAGWPNAGKKAKSLLAQRQAAGVAAAKAKGKAERIEFSRLYNEWLNREDLFHVHSDGATSTLNRFKALRADWTGETESTKAANKLAEDAFDALPEEQRQNKMRPTLYTIYTWEQWLNVYCPKTEAA